MQLPGTFWACNFYGLCYNGRVKGGICVKAWQHLKTITRHHRLVRRGCFKVGLYRQGLAHDLSKLSPAEFWVGAKYYQGNRSPNSAERQEKGYSTAWMHHKGRNKHHWEYWTDLDVKQGVYVPVPMPRNYLVEMVMDRIAACKVYQGKAYTDASALHYLHNGVDRIRMHPQTQRELEYILTMLRDVGEEKTYSYIKNQVLKGKPFPWEQEEQ